MHKSSNILSFAVWFKISTVVILCIVLIIQSTFAENDSGINKIAFASKQNGSDNLVIIDPVTKQEVTRVLSQSTFVWFPVWSPNCDRIVLDRFEGNLKEISIVSYNTEGISDKVKLIEPLEITAYFPHWSPDGQNLVFQGLDTKHPEGNFEIYTLSTLTGNITNLTKDPIQDINAEWSPDGQQIIFAAIPKDNNPKGYFDIYGGNTNGSSVKSLYTDSQTNDLAPLWSPDGTDIAFISNTENGDRLFLLKNDGSIAVLTGTTFYNMDHFSWSNDSKTIALTSHNADDTQILLLDVHNKSIVPLTNTPHTLNQFATWSPDDSQIAFQSNRDGDFEIYTLDMKTRGLTQLTNNTYDDTYPSWSPKTCLSN